MTKPGESLGGHEALSDAAVGDRLVVQSIAGIQDASSGNLALRLMEMGILPGVEIKLIGTAPLGDPLEFELRGYRLSLRRTEASLVAVRKIAP